MGNIENMAIQEMLKGDDNFNFFTEIGKELSKMKCKNCVTDVPTAHMYLVNKDNSGVSFKVTDKVCCGEFKNELESKVASIYQKYKLLHH